MAHSKSVLFGPAGELPTETDASMWRVGRSVTTLVRKASSHLLVQWPPVGPDRGLLDQQVTKKPASPVAASVTAGATRISDKTRISAAGLPSEVLLRRLAETEHRASRASLCHDGNSSWAPYQLVGPPQPTHDRPVPPQYAETIHDRMALLTRNHPSARHIPVEQSIAPAR